MFASDHAGAAVLPRPSYPGVSRIVESADLRTRELAEAMLRLNADHPDGCTEATLLIDGFSIHEQAQLGPVARQLANRVFVREVGDEASGPSPKADLAERMAAVMVREVGRSDSAVAALQQAGFSGREIAAHIDAASAIADRHLLRKAPPNTHLVNLAYAIGAMVVAGQGKPVGA